VLDAQLVVHLAAGTIGVGLLLATAAVIYDLRLPRTVAAAVLVYLAGALALYALSFVLAALAPNARTASAVGFVVYFPMIFLCALSSPARICPHRCDASARCCRSLPWSRHSGRPVGRQDQHRRPGRAGRHGGGRIGDPVLAAGQLLRPGPRRRSQLAVGVRLVG
jgi:hypothetical protein